MTTSII